METAGFVQETETEEVRFRVKAVKNRWRIVEPMLPPHVGQQRMVNFVRESWVKETDPAVYHRTRLHLVEASAPARAAQGETN